MKARDAADRRTAAGTVIAIGGLQKSQDHRLTNGDQRKLNAAKEILATLMHRIKHDLEA